MHGFWLAWFNLARLCMGLSVCVCRASSRACSRQVVGSGSLTTQHPHNTTPQTNTKAGVGRLTTQHNTPKQESDVYTETGEVVSEHPHPHNTTQHNTTNHKQRRSPMSPTPTQHKKPRSRTSHKKHTHTPPKQESDVFAEIGEVVSGKKKGREGDELILVDLTGTGAQVCFFFEYVVYFVYIFGLWGGRARRYVYNCCRVRWS